MLLASNAMGWFLFVLISAAVLLTVFRRGRECFSRILVAIFTGIADGLARALLGETGVPPVLPAIKSGDGDLENGANGKGSLRMWSKIIEEARPDDHGKDVADAAVRFVEYNRITQDTLGNGLRNAASVYKQSALLSIDSSKRLLLRLSQRKVAAISDVDFSEVISNTERLLLVAEYSTLCADLLNHAHNMRMMSGYIWPLEHWGERYKLWPFLRLIWGLEYCANVSRKWLFFRFEEVLTLSKRFERQLYDNEDDVGELRHFMRHKLYLSPVRIDILGIERFWLLRKMCTRLIPFCLSVLIIVNYAAHIYSHGGIASTLVGENYQLLKKSAYALSTGIGVSVGFSWLAIHLGAVDQSRFYTTSFRSIDECRGQIRTLTAGRP